MSAEILGLPHKSQRILAIPGNLMVEHDSRGNPLPWTAEHCPTSRPKIVDHDALVSVPEVSPEKNEELLREMGQLVLPNKVQVQ